MSVEVNPPLVTVSQTYLDGLVAEANAYDDLRQAAFNYLTAPSKQSLKDLWRQIDGQDA